MEKNMDKSILDVLTEYMTNERLDGMLQDNEEYIRTQENINHAMDEYNRNGLPEEQWGTLNKVLNAYNASGAFYAKMAYQQGVKDCVSLMKEIGMV